MCLQLTRRAGEDAFVVRELRAAYKSLFLSGRDPGPEETKKEEEH